MLKIILIKVISIAIGTILLIRLLSISEGITVSILTTPPADKNTLEKTILINPSHAYAYEQLAWLEYQNNNYDGAKQYAIRTLQNNLSSGMATAILTMVFDHTKKPELANQAAQLSAHLWPAHDLSMKMVSNHWLQSGYISKAISAWNVSLNQGMYVGNFAEGEAAKSIFPILNKVAQHKDSTQLFQPYHQQPPLWWDFFFQYMVNQPDNLVAVDRFYQQALLNGNTSEENKKLYLSNLIKEDQWAKARNVWQKGLGKEKAQFDQIIYDGGFESQQLHNSHTDEKFSWTIAPKTDIQAYLDKFSKASGSYSLRVAFNSWIDDYWGYIRQHLVLKPGKYTIKYKTRANLDAQKGVRWVVVCANKKPYKEIGTGESLAGFFDWKNDKINFTIPDDPSCKAQKIALVLAGGNPDEIKVRGDIWFDDFEIKQQEK